jgi:hypothetical protein
MLILNSCKNAFLMNEKKNAKNVLVCTAKKRQKFFFGSVRLKETGGEKKKEAIQSSNFVTWLPS